MAATSSELPDNFYSQRDPSFIASTMIISEKNAQILKKSAYGKYLQSLISY